MKIHFVWELARSSLDEENIVLSRDMELNFQPMKGMTIVFMDDLEFLVKEVCAHVDTEVPYLYVYSFESFADSGTRAVEDRELYKEHLLKSGWKED